MLADYHMISSQNMIDSYKGRFIAGNIEFFDSFDLEDIANSRLLIDSHISKTFNAKLQI